MNGYGPTWKWLAVTLLTGLTILGGHLYGELRERVAAVEAQQNSLIVNDATTRADIRNMKESVDDTKRAVGEIHQLLRSWQRGTSPRTIP